MFDGIWFGVEALFQPAVLIALAGGVFLGLTVGAIPGLNDTITIAILIPLTFGMNPYVALAILIGVYCASSCGGGIPAILINIPGTASAALTSLDGYSMSRNGETGKALGLTITSSIFGGLASSLCLLLFAPFLAKQALRFGPPEYFMLAILGLSTVVGMAGKNISKNLLSMAFGLLLSTVGMSPQAGYARFTFGIPNLLDGLSIVSMIIGLYGITSTLELVETFEKSAFVKEFKRIKAEFPNRELRKRLYPTWIKSSIIGNILGVIPGAGMTMAIYMAYERAVQANPHLEFGTGVPEGIAAPESADNAVVASSMVPLITLGVPGNSTSALFLGALAIHGLRPGPSLFRESPDIAYLLVLGFLLGNLIMIPLSFAFCNMLATPVLKLKKEILSAIVLVFCVTGAFAVGNNSFNIVLIIVFGMVGYLFKKFHIPTSPLILSTVLGSMMESNWIQSMTYANGSLSVFVTRPVSLILVIVTLLNLAMPFIKKRKANKGNKAAASV